MLRTEVESCIRGEGNLGGSAPRYCRLKALEERYGIKRGSAYSLMRAGKIRSCALRVTSKRTRTRLVDCLSVEAYIEEQMKEQNLEYGQAKDLKSVE
jgi:hypothetical protein